MDRIWWRLRRINRSFLVAGAAALMIGATSVAYACTENEHPQPAAAPVAAPTTPVASEAPSEPVDEPDDAEETDAPEPIAGQPARAADAGLSEFYLASNGASEWAKANPNDPRSAAIATKIGAVPQGVWFGNWGGNDQAAVDTIVTAAAAAKKIPLLVMYNIMNRDCKGASQGGAGGLDAYKAWVDQFAAGIKSRTAWVVVEPDATAHLECKDAQRDEALSYAITKVKAAGGRTFLDAGVAGWRSAQEQVAALRAAGVANADGLALNVSNFQFTDKTAAYGKELIDALGQPDLKIVIDTSRNGAGPADGNQWCDPDGRKLGAQPTTKTEYAHVAGLMWVKSAGGLDGCKGQPGSFSPDVAYAYAQAGQ